MSTEQLPTWMLYIQALGPTAVAMSVAYVAWRQWRTASQKLRFDLFDRRLKVYLAVCRVIDTATVHGEFSPEDFELFVRNLEGAEFLFKDEIRAELKSIREKTWDAMTARARYRNSPDHPLYHKLIDQEADVLQYLVGRRDHIQRLFRQQLDVGDI